MLVLAIPAVIVLVTALILAFLFLGVVVGIRQVHPTDLALQPPTCLATFAARVLGLYVRRGVPVSLVNPTADINPDLTDVAHGPGPDQQR